MPVLRTVAAVTVMLSVCLALALGISACGSAPAGSPGAGVSGASASTAQAAGKDAAPPFSGVTLDGKTLTLDQFRGKPLLLVYMTYT